MNILTVYNTCGIRNENRFWYARCIQSILDQNYINNKVVISSCMNSDDCLHWLRVLYSDIDIIKYKDPYTVNITFNKTVQEMVKKYGEFDGYFYIDSGVTLDNPEIITNGVDRLKEQRYGMISFQTDTDTGFESLGFSQDSNTAQIKDNDLIIPVGKACNLHAQIFDNDIYKTFENKIIPDIFRAYCTESTFSFLCAVIKKEWVIVKDILLNHNKGVDGASVGQDHISRQYYNPWNNLLYNRNALEFINDSEAIKVGLGYEECNNIMNHNPDAYDNNFSKYPEQLRKQILKYFYTNETELNYHDIEVSHV